MEERSYENWAEELGPRFVVQLPDIQKGGGRGTFFVGSKGKYDALQKRLANGIWRETRLTSVLVRRFLEGIPASVAICVTRNGILISGLQKQLIDLPYCRGFEENGVFCGHVWGGDTWPESVLGKAREQARKVGNHLASLGYRGIAGIDFIVQPEEEKVYPVEINPRLTGAFPVLSLLHLTHGIVPMEAFHLLEFLNMPYQVDVEGLNRQYARPLNGSHLLVFCGMTEKQNLSGRSGRASGNTIGKIGTAPFGRIPRSGRGEDPMAICYRGRAPGWRDCRIRSVDPLRRLCRILFSYSIEDEKGPREEIPAIVDWIQRQCMAFVSEKTSFCHIHSALFSQGACRVEKQAGSY